MAQELAADHARRILRLDPAALAAVFSDEASPSRYSAVMTLQWGVYGPLTQVRKTFPDIPELAEDIAGRGILNPQTVFAFPRPLAERYVAAVNMMWGASDSLTRIPTSQLHGDEVFYVLIAGERRFRALQHLWAHGCSRCHETFGKEPEGTCFLRHFPHRLIPVNVKVGFTPYEALTDQFAENTHHRPRPEEEAIGFRVFYELMRVREPELTISEFSRRIGHNEGRVRSALRYTHLPEFVQQAVAEGTIPYTSAVALERYHRVRGSEDELKYWLTRAIAEAEMSARRLDELLRTDLEQWRSSQMGLFGGALVAMEMKNLRTVFDRNIARALDRMIGFLHAAVQAQKDGRIGLATSPFGMRSILNALLRMYRLQEILLPAVREAYTAREQQEIDGIRERRADDARWLEEQEQKEQQPDKILSLF